MSRTLEQIVDSMHLPDNCMNNMTFIEYTNNLKTFQEIVTREVLKEDYYDGMRFDDAVYRMKLLARERKQNNNPIIQKALATMKAANKEIAVSMSGRNGETVVMKTLSHLERPRTKVYHNVYVTDGVDETEIDAVVVTDSGLIILEVKKVKSDITITDNGQMFRNDDECFENKPLKEKLEIKEKLLRYCIEQELIKRNEGQDILIDCYVVLVKQRGMSIQVNNQCRSIKWCFSSGINKRIESFYSRVSYNLTELDLLNDVLKCLETNKKKFESKIDFYQLRDDIAEALCLLENDDKEEQEQIKEYQSTTIDERETLTEPVIKSSVVESLHKSIKKSILVFNEKYGINLTVEKLAKGIIIGSAAVAMTISSIRKNI